MSDNPSHIGKAYEEGVGMIKLPSNGVGPAQIRCLLPLDMTFSSSLRHSINFDFVEPLRLRVRFTDGDIGRTWHADGHYDTAFVGIALKDAKLIWEYRQLAASDADAVGQANFGSGQMMSLVSAFAKAVPVIGSNVLGAFPLERIRLEASGQVLIDVPARYLQRFGKRQDGVQRHAGTSLEGDVVAYVYKIELGFDNRFCSNIVGFREPSNLRLTVWPAKPMGNDKHNRRSTMPNARNPTANVVYENKQLQAVSSANGRISLSISN
jgi:hypothetical protein